MSTNEILDALNSEVQRIAKIQASVHRLTEWALGEGAAVSNDTRTPLTASITWPDGWVVIATITFDSGTARLWAECVFRGVPSSSLWLDLTDGAIEHSEWSDWAFQVSGSQQ